MSSSTLTLDRPVTVEGKSVKTAGAWEIVRTVLKPLSSLKLTVVLFALSIVIVLVGTLAQRHHDVWYVVHNYFRTAFAWVEFRDFDFFFAPLANVAGGFYFPGGWLIGGVMAANLLAAHSVRFSLQAKGHRLTAGLFVLLAGIVTTWLVIAGGSTGDGFQAQPFFKWSTLWFFLKMGLAALCLTGVYGWVTFDRSLRIERRVILGLTIALGLLTGWLFSAGDSVVLGDSSMRILWQLIQGALAGFVLLAGCLLLFKKRGGIVLIHGGIGLMMFSELMVGTGAIEAQMHIREGETVNFVQDLRSVEVAIIDSTDPKEDDVVVVPTSILIGKAGTDFATIQHKDLPFDVRLVKFLQNAMVREIKPDETNLATAGKGQRLIAVDSRAGTGTDSGGEVDLSAAYVQFFRKGTTESLGTFVVSQLLRPESVTLDGKTYDVDLRFKRTYKPYSVTLKDIQDVKYVGTDKTRDFSAYIHLTDPTQGVDQDVRIWMNNPLRYHGETFYQSNYHRDERTGEESTGLQVVTNTGWMIPYVSCMIVGVGLLAQFGSALMRFLRRRADAVSERGTDPNGRGTHVAGSPNSRRLADWLVPAAIVVLFAAWLIGQARPAKWSPGQPNLREFARLPIRDAGRDKPLDSLARNSLRQISGKEEFRVPSDDTGWVARTYKSLTGAEYTRKEPAIRWLADLISGNPAADKHKVFRIENLEVLQSLGLEQRSGFTYAWEEFEEKLPNLGEVLKQAMALKKAKQDDKLTLFQRKVLDLSSKIRLRNTLMAQFRHPRLPPIPTIEEFKNDRPIAMQKMQQVQLALQNLREEMTDIQAALVIPTQPLASEKKTDEKPKVEWQPFAAAWVQSYALMQLGQDPDPSAAAWDQILHAWATDDVEKFNSELAKYQTSLASLPLGDVSVKKTNYEAFFNQFAPFYHASVLYLVAFVLVAMSWLGWTKRLNRAAFWLIVFTLLVHTFALVSRVYISGRPPVTNLYSSAVFIGWGAVLLGIILELVYRLGMGNVLSSMAGFATLLIAHQLAGDGDTFTVLQAVLDTQFWLATHVVCITLGYATTFVAGLLGLIYVIRGVITPTLTASIGKDLARMIYGTLCFALLFSFVGTVLGGLWADDSWGRFWGWDPKENGALIIVLWNALILHARWDGMVKDRGLAVLAVMGNITTSWSWFGVNELGKGLHAYGFTEGVLFTLGLFVASQMVIVTLGCLPKDRWWSSRRQASAGISSV
jgi:ABC-type transport system involved in cytochrome c biogenesis permease subunit